MEPSGGPDPLVVVEDLTRRAQRGDAAALEALVRAFTPYVGRICGAIALEAGDDAVQETMIVVVTRLHTLREPAAVRGWVRRIAVREAVRVARPARAVPTDPVDLARIAVDLRDPATGVDVAEVLAGLPPDQRAALVLRHLEGMSEQQAAAELGVAVGTVKSRAHRGRVAFARRWTA